MESNIEFRTGLGFYIEITLCYMPQSSDKTQKH